MTDQLVEAVNAAGYDMALSESLIEKLVERQANTIRELARPDIAESVVESVTADAIKIVNTLKALALIKAVPSVFLEVRHPHPRW